MENQVRHFNIRVYGLILDGRGNILLSDEFRMGMRMTKFPGGGLHFGEGILDCLHREMMEEFGQDVVVVRHYYTTDFYQKAHFYEDHQLISIYYLCKFREEPRFRISARPFDFEQDIEGNQSFRWSKLIKLVPEKDLSLPVDQYVGKMLIREEPLKLK